MDKETIEKLDRAALVALAQDQAAQIAEMQPQLDALSTRLEAMETGRASGTISAEQLTGLKALMDSRNQDEKRTLFQRKIRFFWGLTKVIILIWVFILWVMQDARNLMAYYAFYYEFHLTRILGDETLLKQHGLSVALKGQRIVRVDWDSFWGHISYHAETEDGTILWVDHPYGLWSVPTHNLGEGYRENIKVTEYRR